MTDEQFEEYGKTINDLIVQWFAISLLTNPGFTNPKTKYERAIVSHARSILNSDPSLKDSDTVFEKLGMLYYLATLPSGTEEDPLNAEEAKKIKDIFNQLKAFEETHKNKDEFSLLFEFIKSKILGEERPPKTTVKAVEKIDHPLDKLNCTVFDFFERGSGKPLKVDMTNPQDKKKGKEATVLLGLVFDLDELPEGVTITKQLTPYDRRCHNAVCALHNAGNEKMSVSKIYKTMGGKGRPDTSALEKINVSLTKLGAARIYINSKQEAEVYTSKPRLVYDEPILSFARMTANVNGQITNAVIHVFRKPPLMEFARKRGQITTLDPSIFKTPLSLTEKKIGIEDYLIEQISHMKNGSRRSHKILLKTLYAKFSLTTKKQQERAREDINKLLKYWQSKDCNYIGEGSKLEGDYIFINLCAQKAR